MNRSSMNIAMYMTSIISMNTRRTRRPASLIAMGTGTRGFCTSIRTILTCITDMNTSTHDTRRASAATPTSAGSTSTQSSLFSGAERHIKLTDHLSAT